MEINVTLTDLSTDGFVSLTAVCEVNDYDIDEDRVDYTIIECEVGRVDDTVVDLTEDDLFAILRLSDQATLERALLEEIMYGGE